MNGAQFVGGIADLQLFPPPQQSGAAVMETHSPGRLHRGELVQELPSSLSATSAMSLCSICSGVDFRSVFQSGFRKTIRMGRLDHVFDHRVECVFCSYVAKAAYERRAQLGFDMMEARWTLRRAPLPPPEYLRRSGIEVYSRMSVAAQPRGSKIVVILCLLDWCGEDLFVADSAEPVHIMRRLIPSRFDISTASSWIEADNDIRSRLPPPPPLRSIVEAGYLRVLDVTTGDVTILKEIDARYVALSYVWGEAMPTYLNDHPLSNQAHVVESRVQHSNVAWHCDLGDVPVTIRDAARVTRELGEVYLWVDALCIDQADIQDKGAIIAAMDSIYANAYVTIVAASGEGADNGLARINDSSFPAEPLSVSLGAQISLIQAQPSLEEKVSSTTWNSRGWTFQERILSRRCLIFTRDEVFFTSVTRYNRRESFAVEATSAQIKRKRKRRTGKPGSITEGLVTALMKHGDQSIHNVSYMRPHYVDAVSGFTCRTLTREGDRKDAFQGILHLFYAKWPGERAVLDTLCGLLPAELSFTSFCWKHAGGPSHRISYSSSDGKYLPSWSWVGWSGPVKYEKGYGQPILKEFVILDESNIRFDPEPKEEFSWSHNPVPCMPAKFGQVVLHLWIPLFHSKFRKSIEDGDGVYALPDVDMIRVEVDPTLIARYPRNQTYIILPLMMHWSGSLSGDFLLVEQNGDFYERAGMGTFAAETSLHDWKRFGLAPQHVKLV